MWKSQFGDSSSGEFSPIVRACVVFGFPVGAGAWPVPPAAGVGDCVLLFGFPCWFFSTFANSAAAFFSSAIRFLQSAFRCPFFLQ